MDAQQELFTYLKLSIEAKGYEVYDSFLPPPETPYPFVYLGDFQQTDAETKTNVIGSVFPTIHVWHNNPRKRGDVSKMLLDIKTICRSLSHTDSYAWNARNVTSQIIPDNTTKQPLLHGIVEAELQFS